MTEKMRRPTHQIMIASIVITAGLVASFDIQSRAADEEKMQDLEECGWAGVQVSPMTALFADSLGLVEPYGAIFDRPETGGPAAKAGIEAGDVLTTINGVPLEKSSDFRRIIATWAPGSVVYLNTWRDGQLMPRTLTLGSSHCLDQPSASTSQSTTRPTLAAKPALTFDTNQLGQRGSLLLAGIFDLIGQSSQLQTEVNSTLTALGKIADEVTCTGAEFPGQWNNLAGIRVAPYACDFGQKWLLIEATVIVTGPNGKVYDSITPAAINNAEAVTQRTPTWVWTAKNPMTMQSSGVGNSSR